MKEPNAVVTTKKPIVYSQNSVLAVIAVVVLVLLGFYVGTLYQKSHNQPGIAGYGRMMSGRFDRFGGGMRGGLGTVTSVSSSSITITTDLNNASKTYSIDSNTKIYNNGQTASVSDIKSGDQVLIRTSGSGSTTATQIDINPSRGGGMMP